MISHNSMDPRWTGEDTQKERHFPLSLDAMRKKKFLMMKKKKCSFRPFPPFFLSGMKTALKLHRARLSFMEA